MIKSLELLELNYNALKLRKKFGLDDSSPIDIFAIANNIQELTLVFADLGKNLSGLCYKEDDMIVINSEQSYGRCRFTLAHEFFHYFIEDNKDKIVCSTTLSSNPTDDEKLADMFASYFLAPYNAFKDKIANLNKESITEEDIIRLEQYFGMSRLAILYRLKLERLIDNNWDRFTNNVIANAQKLGYDDKLYKKTNYGNKTFGKYLYLVKDLTNRDLISKGKQIELLLTAFREDLLERGVNGDNSTVD